MKYIFLVLLAASWGCFGGLPPSVAPAGMTPGDAATVRAWIAEFTPAAPREYSIRPWRYRNEQGAAAGRATVRIAPPDSLRFDYRGPFRRRGNAALVGDSALWVEPEEEFRGLVNVAPLFWAALGLPLDPPPGARIAVVNRADLRAWQYTVDEDTLTFVVRGSPPIQILAEIREAGRTTTRAQVELDPITGFVVKSRLDFPLDVSRFEFTVESVDTAAAIDPSVWHRQP